MSWKKDKLMIIVAVLVAAMMLAMPLAVILG